jgi:hypothetical protein
MATVSQVTEAVFRSRFEDQTSAGAAAARRAVEALGVAAEETDHRVTRAERSARAWVNANDNLSLAARRTEKAQRDLAAAEAALEAGLAKGEITAEQAARAKENLARKAREAEDRLRALQAATAPASEAAQLLANRLDAAAEAAQRAASYQAALNQTLGVSARSGEDYARRAADIAAYGQELDRLRAKYSPLYAAQQQYRATLQEIAQAERVGALAAVEAAAARQRTKDAFAQQVLALRGIPPATDEAGKAVSGLGGRIGQLGFQAQDLVVQLQAGGDALVAVAQQGSQALGMFGSTGAIAGFALAVAAVIARLVIGKSEIQRFNEEMERQAEQHREAERRASDYTQALRSQGDQYRSAEVAGQRYREGLRGEGETLVQLTRYYQGLTEAQLEYERRRERTTTQNNAAEASRLRSGVLGAINGRLTQAPTAGEMGLYPLAAIGGGGLDPSTQEDYRQATEAITRFRQANVVTQESVLALRQQLQAAVDENGAYAASINVIIQSLDRLIPQLEQLTQAQERARLRQLALSGQASPEQVRALADAASNDVGGAYQQRQQLTQQRTDIERQLRVETDPQRIAAYRSSLVAIQQALEGLTPATEQYMRGLREQVALSRETEGAARELAQAELEIDRATRAAGEGQASAGQKAEARRLVQQRLTEELNTALVAANEQVNWTDRVADAYLESAQAGAQAEIAQRAWTEALKYGKEGSVEHESATRSLTASLTRQAEAQARVNSAKALQDQRDQIELLRRETELLGANSDVRERELAILRERQRILNEDPGANLGSAENRQRLSNAGQIAGMTRELQQQQNSWNELSRVGEQAFDRIGGAITEAFANGSLKAVNFKNIAKAVFSEVIQAAMRMAVVNPLMNSLFGGTRPTLGGLGGSMTVSDSSGGGLGGLFNSIGSLFGGSSSGSTSFGPSSGGGFWSSIGSLFGSGSSSGRTSSAASSGGGGFWSSIGSFFGFGGGSSSAPVGGAAQAAGVRAVPGGMSAAGTSPTSAMGGVGSTIGGIGAGFGMGMMANSLARGNSQGAMIGAGIGSVVGAIWGPIGSMVGGTLGGLVGGLFGNSKPSNKEGTSTIDLDTYAQVEGGMTGKKFSQENRDAAKSITDRIADLDEALEKALETSINGSINVGVGSRDGIYLRYGEYSGRYGRDEKGVNALLAQVAYGMVDSVESELSATLKQILKASGDDGNKLVENIDWYTTVYKPLTEAAEPLDQYEQALKDLNSQYDEAVKKAKQLGLAETELEQRRVKAIEQLEQQRREAVAPTITSTVTSLADYIQSLRSGQLSPISARGQFVAAQGEFDRLYALAAGGDYTALTQIAQAADTLLNAGREVEGSGAGYTALFERVTGALGDLGTSLDEDKLTASLFVLEGKKNTEILEAAIDRMTSVANALLAETRQNGNRPGRLAA